MKTKINLKLELSKRTALLFGVPVLGLVVGMIGYLGFVSPQNAKAHRTEAQVAVLQQQLAAARSATPAPKSVPVQAADLFRLAKAMPDSADMPGILRNLTRLAKASNVTIASVSPGAAVPLALGYGALPVDVTIDGSFANISKFLGQMRAQVDAAKKLKVTGRLLVANEVDVSSGDGRAVSADLKLDAFIYGMAPPSAPAPTTATAATG